MFALNQAIKRFSGVLIKKNMIDAMKPGSVTMDLAAKAGGNIETTVADKVVNVNGVTCIGHTNVESMIASTASTLYGGNCTNLLLSMDRDGMSFVLLCLHSTPFSTASSIL